MRSNLPLAILKLHQCPAYMRSSRGPGRHHTRGIHASWLSESSRSSRTGWQILNALHDAGSMAHEQIAELLRPFASAGSLTEQIAHLSGRGLIESEGDAAAYRLTDRGRQVHADALATQRETRWRAAQGVSEADYLTAIRVLQRIVKNLGEGSAESLPGAHQSEQGR